MNLTYKFSSKYTNKSKIHSIRTLAKVYKSYYNTQNNKTVHDFYKNGKLPKYLPLLENFDFSERYKQTCGSQVKSNIESYFSNIKNKITSTISKSSLNPDTKIILHYINKYHLWFNKSIILKGNNVSQDLLKLSRRLFKQFKGKIPKLRNITMCLDAKVVSIEKSKNSFNYWIKLSTLNKNHPIYLPIKSYDYFENAKGKLKNFVQIIIKKEFIEYGFIKEIFDKKYEQKEYEKVIGVDLGMVTLLATSTGNLYGHGLYKKLKHFDEIITRITRNRQRSGLSNNSSKLDRLYSRVRSLIKNEVGRVLNRFLEKEKPDVVVLEKLTGLTRDTRDNKKLSKRIKRLLNNCGISKVSKRLDTKSKQRGFRIEEINSAYTSQECPICHYIDSRNRRDQARFECMSCGYKRHADYVGSMNIRDRRSIPGIGIYTPYRAVKGLIGSYYLGFG